MLVLVCAPVSATQGRYTCASTVGKPATEFRRNRTHPDIGRRWTSLSRESVVPVPIFKYFALGRGQNRNTRSIRTSRLCERDPEARPPRRA